MPTGFELCTGAESRFPFRVKCPVRERLRPTLVGPTPTREQQIGRITLYARHLSPLMADQGRENERQTGLSGLRYALFRRQRVMSGLRAARCSQAAERRIFDRRSYFRASFLNITGFSRTKTEHRSSLGTGRWK